MWRCPKCQSEGLAASRICRRCGSILEEVPGVQDAGLPAEPSPSGRPSSERGASAETAPSDRPAPEGPIEPAIGEPRPAEAALSDDGSPAWTCKKCGERHPRGQPLCWNCGTDQEGREDPGFVHVDDMPAALEREPVCDPELRPPAGPFEAAARTGAAAEPAPPTSEARPPPSVARCARCGSQRIVPDVGIICPESGKPVSAVFYERPGALLFKLPHESELRGRVCADCGHVELRISDARGFYREYRSIHGGG